MLMSACEKAKTMADRVGPSREGARVVVRGEQKQGDDGEPVQEALAVKCA